VDCGGDTWRLAVGCADASDDVSVWTGLVDLVHRSTVDRVKGYAALLIRAVDLDRTADAACRRRRRRPDSGGGAKRRRRRRARRRRAKLASRAPKRTGKTPEGRGECEDLYHGLEGVGAAPEEEIGAAGRRWRRCSGGGTVEEWRSSGERCGVEVRLGLALYRAEGGRGEGGRGGAGRSVAPAPLMAARCGRRPLRGGEEARTAVGECAAP
jgi:hypothetical protein